MPQPRTLGLRGWCGGRDSAGDGQRGEGERGNFSFERDEELHPVEGRPMWFARPLDGRFSNPVHHGVVTRAML